MIIESERQVTDAVIEEMRRTPNARTKVILECLVRTCTLSSERPGSRKRNSIEPSIIVSALGQRTTESHNETRLMRDRWSIHTGMPSQTCDNAAIEAPQTCWGPFGGPFAQDRKRGSLLRSSTPGPSLFFKGWVRDQEGRPIVERRWMSGTHPYRPLRESRSGAGRNEPTRKFTTDADGSFSFRSVKPAGYPIRSMAPSVIS